MNFVFWLFWLSCQYLPSDWLERPLWGWWGIVSRKPRPKNVYDFLSLLYCFIVLLCVSLSPVSTWYIFLLLWHDIYMFVLTVPLNTKQTNKQTSAESGPRKNASLSRSQRWSPAGGIDKANQRVPGLWPGTTGPHFKPSLYLIQGGQTYMHLIAIFPGEPGLIGLPCWLSFSVYSWTFSSVLWHCRLGDRRGIQSVRKLDVGLLVVTIWLQVCNSSGCHHHFHHR